MFGAHLHLAHVRFHLPSVFILKQQPILLRPLLSTHHLLLLLLLHAPRLPLLFRQQLRLSLNLSRLCLSLSDPLLRGGDFSLWPHAGEFARLVVVVHGARGGFCGGDGGALLGDGGGRGSGVGGRAGGFDRRDGRHIVRVVGLEVIERLREEDEVSGWRDDQKNVDRRVGLCKVDRITRGDSTWR